MNAYDDAKVIVAIDSSPSVIREAVTSRHTSLAIATIGTAYHLHIDTLGKLAQINRNMLIGLMNPTEALGALVLEGVSAESAKAILGDLNKDIFIPLQAKIKGGGVPEVIATKPEVVVQDPVIQELSTMPVVVSETPVPQPLPALLTPTQQVPVLETIPQTPAFNLIRPEVQSPEVALPELRTMQRDIAAMQKPHESSQSVEHPKEEPPKLYDHQVSPARSFQTASVPVELSTSYVAAQPSNTPITPEQITPTPLYNPQVAARLQAEPQTIPSSGQYIGDPYREAI